MKNQHPKAPGIARIPPPPELEDGFDAIVAYHAKYSMEELEKAGYLEDVPPDHVREVAAAAAYQLLCRRGLHVKLSRKDYERLALLAAGRIVSVENLVKKWLKERLAKEQQRLTNAKR